MEAAQQPGEGGEVEVVPPVIDEDKGGSDEIPAWEQLEMGRYRPRRIRGSCRGRALG